MKRPNFQLSRLLLLTLALLLLSAAVVIPRRGNNYRSASTVLDTRQARIKLPPVMIWAWERPENLSFIDPAMVGVAFLAKTIYLCGDQVITHPRLQPLEIPSGTAVIAVTRIESDRLQPPSLSTSQIKQAAAEISKLALLPNVSGIQIDFDARYSERIFYRQLISDLRQNIPNSSFLSITALASWCKGDNWLADLPVDEAVPMLFRMGVDRNQILSYLAAGERLAIKCQTSAGISLDEHLEDLPNVSRLYVFNPKPWSATSVNHFLETHEHEIQDR